MSRKPGNYQYQKITTTTRTVTLPNKNKYSEERKTISTTNSLGGSRAKVDLNTLNKSENIQFFKCNRCGKLKYNINEKQTSLETGSWSKRSEMTEINRKTRSYEKYGTATNPKCTCGKDHSNCICGKGQYSLTTTVTKRSDNVKGQIDQRTAGKQSERDILAEHPVHSLYRPESLSYLSVSADVQTLAVLMLYKPAVRKEMIEQQRYSRNG